MKTYETSLRGPEAVEDYLNIMRLSFGDEVVARKRAVMPWLLDHRPKQNPYRTCILVLTCNGEIVGGTLFLADEVWLDGAVTPALLPQGIHVHPEHRGRGLKLLKAAYHVIPEGAVFGIANDEHHAIQIRFGALPSKIRTVRFRAYRAGFAVRRRFPWFTPFVNAGSLLLSSVLDLCVPAPRRGERIETISRFDADFDVFWEKARESQSFLCVRSADRMQWRYIDTPCGPYFVDVLRRDGAIVGMIVTRISEKTGRRVGQVSDILCVEPSVRDYAVLLGHAGKRFGKHRVDFAEYAFIGHEALDKAGQRAGFWFPRKSRHVVATGNGARDLAAVKKCIGDMHFLRGDHDEDY